MPRHARESEGALYELIHDSFRALVLHPRFVCVGAKAAIRRGSYRMGVYAEIGSGESTVRLARDLRTFVDEHRREAPTFLSFVASFTGSVPPSELGFERLLWEQLQALHDTEEPAAAWDPSVSADPDDPRFSFSFAGQAFFVVGLHALSSRWARRFPWPTLVFNRHDQFERLRTDGRYPALQRAIRARDVALQGSSNPMLANFGSRSEARQYSGRAVEDDWSCPFHVRTPDTPAP